MLLVSFFGFQENSFLIRKCRFEIQNIPRKGPLFGVMVCCGKENSAGQGACCWLKLGGGGVEVFRPACTFDMSVLDVLVHKMRARGAKIRLDKLKESENDAVMSVYSDIFFDSYDDESPQDKATRKEEEKKEAELEEAEEAMWSSFSVGGWAVRRVSGG